MATETETITAQTGPTFHATSSISDRHQSTVTYPDPEYSHTFLNYYKDSDAPPPDQLNSTLTEHELRIARRGESSPNIARTPVSIRNIQGHEHEYNIAQHGFKVSPFSTRMNKGNWRDDEELKRIFFPEIDALLKRETGAKWTMQYEWHVRTGTLEDALSKDSEGKVDINGPVRRVHIDESPASGLNEFRYYCERDGLKDWEGREVAIFNVWLPLRVVRRDPLCLCEAPSVEDEDLHSGKVQVPNVGEIENFAIRPPVVPGAHKFVYVREQRPNQALVFRIMDSRVDHDASKRSCGVAHTSFVDPGTEGKEARESVEVRSFCVF